MGKNVIVLCANQNYLFALLTILQNLRNINNKNDIYIYYCDLSSEAIQLILNEFEHIHFKEFTFQDWEKSCLKNVKLNKNAIKNIERYTHLNLCKYKFAELLEYYEKVLFLDLDIIIHKNLDCLFLEEKSGYRDGASFISKYKKGSTGKLKLDNNEFKNVTSPNGGLFFYTRDLNWRKFIDLAEYFTISNINHFQTNLDELAISYSFFKLNYNLTHFKHDTYNCLFYNYIPNKTVISHFLDSYKPWNNLILSMTFPKWINNFYYIKSKFPSLNLDQDKIHYSGKDIIETLNTTHWRDILSLLDISKFPSLKPNFSTMKFLWFLFDYNKYCTFELRKHKRGSSTFIALCINKDFFYIEESTFLNLIDKFNMVLKIRSNDIYLRSKFPINLDSFYEDFLNFYKSVDLIFSKKN